MTPNVQYWEQDIETVLYIPTRNYYYIVSRTNCTHYYCYCTTTGFELKEEIEGTNQFEDEKRTNTKGKKRRTGTQSLNTGIHKEGEEGDLLCIIMPYLISTTAVAAVLAEREEEGVLVL